MAPEENHEDMEQALAENSSSYANVKKWASEFKCGRDSTEAEHPSGSSIKPHPLINKLMPFTVWFWVTADS